MDENNLLYVHSFSPDVSGHGGNRRTAQIIELLASSGLIAKRATISESTRLDRYVYGFSLWGKKNFKYFKNFKTLGSWGGSYIAYLEAFNRHTGNKVVIWEDTKNYSISYLAKDCGYKLVAMPQNLESLVKSKDDISSIRAKLEGFEAEILYLAKSDAIFCISREEQWLLKLWGIDADFLPYYPAQQIVDRLLEVRKVRSCSEKSKFLVLGTAGNSPTLIGMIEQIQLLEKVRKEINFEVDIAGYGTENLKEYCQDSSINLLGTVSSSQLHDLMTGAIAVLIHQKAGVGALTRIPEMLIAGIPVIASSNACRSAYEHDGIHCYENQSELTELMKSSCLGLPKFLHRPVEAEKRFIERIKALV